MLIEFRVKNYRSFRDEQTFSLVAATGNEMPDNCLFLPEFDKARLLRSAVVYGANASGKSNLLKAIAFVRLSVLESAQEGQAGDLIETDPFLLDSDSTDQPCEFEFTFLVDQVRYQYGFVVGRRQVKEEWLIAYPQRLPQRWFERSTNGNGEVKIKFSTHLKGEKQRLAKLTRPNALYLSVAAKWNHQQLTSIFTWFRSHLSVLLAGNVPLDRVTANRCQADEGFRNWVSKMLRLADFGVDEVSSQQVDVEEAVNALGDDLPRETREVAETYIRRGLVNVPVFFHKHYGSSRRAQFSLHQESDGTRRLFGLLSLWREVLDQGSVLFIDELDSSMHPLLTRKLIAEFHDPEINIHGAQLVFTTHDTSLLSQTIFRRDQIWFTEKDRYGASHLYSLQDYGPRKNEALEKGYLAGRYGAVPVFEEWSF